MAKKMCIECGLRPITKEAKGPEVCDPCFDYAGWENTHSDSGHDENPDDLADEMAQCPVCHPELDMRKVAPAKGHTNTAPRSRHPHTACKHGSNPKERGACRKANRWDDKAQAWVPKA